MILDFDGFVVVLVSVLLSKAIFNETKVPTIKMIGIIPTARRILLLVFIYFITFLYQFKTRLEIVKIDTQKFCGPEKQGKIIF